MSCPVPLSDKAQAAHQENALLLPPTSNPLTLLWPNQPCLPSSPGDPERWNQAQTGVRDPLVPSRSLDGLVLARPTCRVLPRGTRPRGLGAPSCSMVHRGL